MPTKPTPHRPSIARAVLLGLGYAVLFAALAYLSYKFLIQPMRQGAGTSPAATIDTRTS